MTETTLNDAMEDHTLEAVSIADRKNWIKIIWSTAGLVTTLIILFFGALVCFAGRN